MLLLLIQKFLQKNKLLSQSQLKNNTRFCSKYTDNPDYKRKYELDVAKPINPELLTSKQGIPPVQE